MKKIKEYLSLFGVFFKIGAVTFGGGYSMLPILEHEIEKKRGWVTRQELLDYFAIGQTLPGIISVNVATFVGSKRKGVWGAAAAVLGVVTPSVLVITLIAAFIGNITHYPVVQKLLFGTNIGVAALLVYAVADMAKKAVVDVVTLLLAVAGFVAVAFFGIHSVALLAVGIAAGLAVKWRPKRKKKPPSPGGGPPAPAGGPPPEEPAKEGEDGPS